MDTLRGNFGSSEFSEDSADFDLGEDENFRDLPPAAIGQDERRMQVRAYNHWASMLGERNFPSVEELEPQHLDDFGPYSVLLDFSLGIDDPTIRFLGEKLAEECDANAEIGRLSDVPSRSLLSRITDHYMQILANQAPIGFEAEFVNQRDVTILYRGILLPFSSDNETIDFIYGVINWKEVADAAKADELLLEIDQALEPDEISRAQEDAGEEPLTLTELAPWNEEAAAQRSAFADGEDQFAVPGPWSDDQVSSINALSDDPGRDAYRLPTPTFGDYDLGEDEEEEDEANYNFASLTDHVDLPTGKSKALDLDELGAQLALQAETAEILDEDDGSGFSGPNITFSGEFIGDEPQDEETGEIRGEQAQAEDFGADTPEDSDTPDHVSLTEFRAKPGRRPLLDPVADFETETGEADAGLGELPEDAGLFDYLASARELALVASESEDRSRSALYAAVGRAFDVALAAKASPEEYDELLAENGLAAQERAPMTPVVKLVFGADYDKTRLTEYAAVLGYASRIGLEHGQLETYLASADGGIKGVVQAERRLRREEAGKVIEPQDEVRSALADRLRGLDPQDFTDIPQGGGEFALVMIRRTEDGDIVMLGEIEQDIALIERAARKLLG